MEGGREQIRRVLRRTPPPDARPYSGCSHAGMLVVYVFSESTPAILRGTRDTVTYTLPRLCWTGKRWYPCGVGQVPLWWKGALVVSVSAAV